MTLTAPNQSLQSQNDDKDVVLSVKNVSKRFCRDLKRSLFYGVQDIAGEVFGAKRQNVELRKGEFWALKDVSFDLKRGEALGLVGANGAGKTTLLRIISGLIRPDHGSVEVNGRVAPLIALGAGFNPILTGRENLYVNMSILGLTKEEIDERLDEVIDFAEIGEAIDAPVQSYSSGMAARLGFASAIFTEPEILLIDEVLAVGDIKFKEKCHRKLGQLRKLGTSFILVTHSSPAIQKVCNFAVFLKKGRLIESGNTGTVLATYENNLLQEIETKNISDNFSSNPDEKSSSCLRINYILFQNDAGEPIAAPITGNLTSICIGCHSEIDIQGVGAFIAIDKLMGGQERSLLLSNINDNKKLELKKGQSQITLRLPHLGLSVGLYAMTVIIRQGGLNTFDYVENFEFKVISEMPMDGSAFYQPRYWSIENIRNNN